MGSIPMDGSSFLSVLALAFLLLMRHPSFVLSLIGFLALIPVSASASSIPYGSPDYTFSYPSEYHLKQYLTPEGGIVGQSIYNRDLGLPEDALTIGQLSYSSESFLSLPSATDSALRSCDRLREGVKVRCTGVLLSAPFETPELQGYRFFLREESDFWLTGKVASRMKGPIYILNERISSGVIMMSYDYPTAMSRKHLRLAERILRSVIGD